MHDLTEPLTKTLQAPADDTQEIDLAPVQIAHVTHLCDLLCFFVIQHTYRSKFFIISTNVGTKVSLLLRAKPKHVRLGTPLAVSFVDEVLKKLIQPHFGSSEHALGGTMTSTIGIW